MGKRMGFGAVVRNRSTASMSRVKPLAAAKIEQVVHMTLHEKPPNATHWSVRSMAAVAGISYSSVQRIWHAHGLKPHLVETFKVSRDKNFAAKVEDVVGLYLNPRDSAGPLCRREEPNPSPRPHPTGIAHEEGWSSPPDTTRF
jgi:hypothetical protein